MEEGMRKLSCGNCGHDQFEVYSKGEHHVDRLVVECKSCSSTTVLTVTRPKIEMRFGERSDGIMCHLGGENEED